MNSAPINFIKFKGPFVHFREIREGNISLTKAEENEEDFKKGLCWITSGNHRYKEKNQLDTIKSVKNIYNSRQKIIDIFNDSSKIRSEAICKANKKTAGTGHKILTPKQMIQRLPITLAPVKAGNNSNEIRQIVYSLYQSKQITKKVYDNIIKSIQLHV